MAEEVILVERIIISFSNLSRETWGTIDSFIEEVQKSNIINPLLYPNLKISVHKHPNNHKRDICSIYEGTLIFSEQTLSKNSELREFNLIYTKQTADEDISSLVPFFLLKKEFQKKITLGIDISSNNIPAYSSKCKDFFSCIEYEEPLYGKENIYFINRNQQTGDFYSVLLSDKKDEDQKDDAKKDERKKGTPRYFLPLLEINANNFVQLFDNSGNIESNSKSKEVTFIEASIAQISKDLRRDLNFLKEDNFQSIFEKWFTIAYFYSLGSNAKVNDSRILLSVLHSYYINIFELVQNIIYHTEKKEGLIYCIFSKKGNVLESQRKNIIDFDSSYDENSRFLEIGIFDYGKEGIVDTYFKATDEQVKDDADKKKQWEEDKKDITLRTFFDIEDILTTGIGMSDFRYAANMGLKSFANSIRLNNGYFRVESNDRTENQKNVVRIAPDNDGKDLRLQKDEVSIKFLNGTHYEIILPVKKIVRDSSLTTGQTRTQDSYSEQSFNQYDIIPEISLKSIFDDLKTSDINSKLVTNKKDQIEQIKEIGEWVVTEAINRSKKESKHSDSSEIKNRIIALNIGGIPINATYILKIIAYIQFHYPEEQHPIESLTLVLTQLNDNTMQEICGLIRPLLDENHKSRAHVWNNSAPVVLISDKLKFQILCGESRDDFLYLNQQISVKYLSDDNYFKNYQIEQYPDETFKKISNKLVDSFYDCSIKDKNGHFGSTMCYAFLQAAGYVNDHLVGCFCRETD